MKSTTRPWNKPTRYLICVKPPKPPKTDLVREKIRAAWGQAVVPEGTTWTYFVQDQAGFIKIGRSKNPAKRLADLQTAHSQELRLLATVPADVEEALHSALAPHRVRGEWFRASPQVLDLVWEAAFGEMA